MLRHNPRRCSFDSSRRLVVARVPLIRTFTGRSPFYEEANLAGTQKRISSGSFFEIEGSILSNKKSEDSAAS